MRRGNGEGNIKRRTDGRWEARVSAGYRDGKPVRKSIYSNTRAEVQRKMTKVKADFDQGIAPTDDHQTVRDFLERWLEVSARQRVRPLTYTSYEGHIRLHLVPALGRIKLSKLSPRDIQAFMNHKVEGGLSPHTVRNIRATLRVALGQAVRWGELPRNVAELVDPPRVPHHEIRPFTPEEAKRFLQAIKGHRLEALYSVALALGLRRGEALGLHWDDVDLEQGTVSVRFALQRVNRTLQRVEPKSARSRRTIAIPDFALKALREHRARQLEERLLAGSRWKETGSVFTTTIGTPLDPDNVNRNFKPLLEAAGLRPQRFHDLRHACASLLLVQGVSPRVVMETLGHSQISLTMNTYSHVIPQLQREAAEQMNSLLTS